MLIGIDASRANRPNRSGVEWYAYNLVKHFYKIDSANQFLLYSDKPLIDDLKPQSANFKEKVLSWPMKRLWTLGRLSLEMAINKPDVLFVPSHTFPLIKAKHNIITWHDVGYERYPETYTTWELASLRQGAKRALKMADTIITVSNFTKHEMIDHYQIDPEKIKVIYLGCDHQFWQPAAAAKQQQLKQQLGLNKPYFIYVGRLALRKNIIGLIRIYNLFRDTYHQDCQLVLAGSPSPYQDEIDREIGYSAYKDDIIKLGWYNQNALPVLLSGAEALVYPSFYEGFGMPIIEAMACGVPVVASTSGSLPEIIDQAGLLVNAHDVSGFAERLQAIMNNSALKQTLIKQGKERANEFTWEKCSQETLNILTRS